MRRILILSAVAALVLTAVPASAGGDNRVTVKPDPVELGGVLTIIARNCEDGDGWTAKVVASFQTEEDGEVYQKSKNADDDGTTRLRVEMSNENFNKGVYTVVVKCKHRFGPGESGVYYEITKTIRVKKPD